MSISFDGDFYDADYFENGRASGKGWLTNYRWLPRRSFKEAFAYIEYFGLDESSYVLDFGCAKGFIVKALRSLNIKADGCDISNYALSFAPSGCWNCTKNKSWDEHKGYTHIVCKDVLEHLTKEQLENVLSNFVKVADKVMCIVPMGDNGKYRIAEYHTEISHLIAENESWWKNVFIKSGWSVKKSCPHVPGLKDNWRDFAGGVGNHVYVLEKKKNLQRIRIEVPDEKYLQLHRNTKPELNEIVPFIDFKQLSRYPDIETFLDKLSSFLKIDKENIMLSSGIDGSIRTIFEQFVIKKAMILLPTYKMYEVYANALDKELVEIHSNKDTLQIDINEIIENISEVDVLFIPNPHVPVENVFYKQDIENILRKSNGKIVVIDEAYFMFGSPSMINLISKYDNLLVMRSFSKAFGLPSIRLGYTIGNKELITRMNSTRLAYETNSLSMSIASWAIDNLDVFKEYISEVIDSRTYIKQEFSKLGFKTHGSLSNTIMVKTGQNTSNICKQLKKRNVLVKVLLDFPEWLFITIGKRKTMLKFITIFKEYI